jgi:hypothetical protein
VTVSVAEDALPRFDAVVNAARRAGLDVVGEPMAALGTLSGRIAVDRVDALRKVPGVAGVELAREVSIPPPDRDVQ